MVGGALAGGVLVLVTALARAAVGRAAAVAALEPPAMMAVCLVEWTVDRAGAVLVGAVLAGAVAAALVGGVVFMEADCVLAGVSGSATAAVSGELVDRPPPAAAEARRRKAGMSVALGAVEVERSWLLQTSHPSFSSPALRAAIVCGAITLNGFR